MPRMSCFSKVSHICLARSFRGDIIKLIDSSSREQALSTAGVLPDPGGRDTDEDRCAPTASTGYCQGTLWYFIIRRRYGPRQRRVSHEMKQVMCFGHDDKQPLGTLSLHLCGIYRYR